MSFNHLAIVGYGSIGRRHAGVAKELFPDATISLFRSSSSNPNIMGYNEYPISKLNEARFLGVEAAIIASPAPFHIPQARLVVAQDVPVLVEKPLSTKVSDAEAFAAFVNQKGVGCLIGFVLRHHPSVKFIKDKLLLGIIGEVLHARVVCGSYLPDWRSEGDFRESVSARRELGGGVIWELSHELDYIQYFLGAVDQVFAIQDETNSLGLGVPEAVQCVARLSRGGTVSIHLDFNSRNPARYMVVNGTLGELVWDVLSSRVTITTSEKRKVTCFKQPSSQMYHDQLINFEKICHQNLEPIVSTQEGVNAVRFAAAIIESIRTRKISKL